MGIRDQIDRYAEEHPETVDAEIEEPAEDEPVDESPEEIDDEEVDNLEEEEDAEEDEEADGFDYAGWDPDNWSRRPEDLPPPLLTTYKTMQGGYTKKMQELAERGRILEEREKRFHEREQQFRATEAATEDPRPENPTEDMTAEQVYQRMDEITRWNVRQEINRSKPKDDPKPDAPTRPAGVEYIENHPQWNQELDNKMAALAKEDPSWYEVLKTEAGGKRLMEAAQREMELESLKESKTANEKKAIREQASKSKKRTPGARKKNPGVDEFAAVFDEKDPIKRARNIIRKNMG